MEDQGALRTEDRGKARWDRTRSARFKVKSIVSSPAGISSIVCYKRINNADFTVLSLCAFTLQNQNFCIANVKIYIYI